MADIKWIKLSTDLFNNRKIRMIESMPEGDALVVIWLKILVLAGNTNDNGVIYFTPDIPYTEQMLATEFGRPLNIIQLALNTFQRFGMIDIVNNFIQISNWEKYQNVDGLEKVREQTRNRVAAFRERQKVLIECNATSNATVTDGNATDKDIDIDKDIYKEKENKEKEKRYRFTPPTYEEVKQYCKERNNNIDPEQFIAFYESKGWKVGNQPMKNWKSAIVTWEKRDKEKNKDEYIQHNYKFEEKLW